MTSLVNYRELFNLVLAEDLLSLFEVSTYGSSNEVVLCHDLGDLRVEVCKEAHITVCDDTDELVLVINYRNA